MISEVLLLIANLFNYWTISLSISHQFQYIITFYSFKLITYFFITRAEFCGILAYILIITPQAKMPVNAHVSSTPMPLS
jgi:hypothetical protein